MAAEAEGELVDRSTGVVIRPVRAEDVEAGYEVRRQPSVVELTLALPSVRIEDTRRFPEGFGTEDHVLAANVGGRAVGMAGLLGMGRVR